MSSSRRFLVAPALVRLIRKERGGTRITEGHFAPQGGRSSYVRVDGQLCQLVLVNGSVEERTDVPRAHGDALLDVCPGKAAYDRTAMTVAGREVRIDRYVSPGSLDLVSVAFDSEADAAAFQPPAWFGREVGDEPAYARPALAIQGIPAAEESTLSNAALDAVLDLIEPRFAFGRYGSQAGRNAEAGEAAARRTPPVPAPEPAAPPVTAPPPEAAGPEPILQDAAPPAPVHIEPAHAEAARPEPIHAEPIPPEPVRAEPARPEPLHPEPPAAAEPTIPGAVHAEAHAPHASAPQASAPHAAEPRPGQPSDARIDDVIESLSQALGAAIQQHPDTAESKDKGDAAPVFERWTVRPRRTQQT